MGDNESRICSILKASNEEHPRFSVFLLSCFYSGSLKTLGSMGWVLMEYLIFFRLLEMKSFRSPMWHWKENPARGASELCTVGGISHPKMESMFLPLWSLTVFRVSFWKSYMNSRGIIHFRDQSRFRHISSLVFFSLFTLTSQVFLTVAVKNRLCLWGQTWYLIET